MACNPTQVLTDACTSGVACLSDHDLLVVIAQLLADGAEATDILEAACTSGINCLGQRDLIVAIAQLNCAAASP